MSGLREHSSQVKINGINKSEHKLLVYRCHKQAIVLTLPFKSLPNIFVHKNEYVLIILLYHKYRLPHNLVHLGEAGLRLRRRGLIACARYKSGHMSICTPPYRPLTSPRPRSRASPPASLCELFAQNHPFFTLVH